MKENIALPKNVGIWIRVSTEDQASGDSPKVHETRARGFVTAKGWQVQEVYDLAGVSGKSVMQHPECKRMLADVKRGHISGLVFSSLSRLSRNLGELRDLAKYFDEHEADLISLSESIDTSTAGGRMFFNLLGVFAEWFREDTAERITASTITRTKMGKILNGSAPYGFKAQKGELLLVPEEAQVRRLVYELFLEHRRKFTVARILNEKGYRTRKGRLWEEIQISDMLADTSAKGVYFFHRQKRVGPWKFELRPESEWGRIECPRIVSDEVWNEANRILEETRRAWKQPGRLPTQPFSKLTWCECGGKMYARTDSPKYLCRKCNNKIAIPELEDIFHKKIKAFFANPEQLAATVLQSGELIKEKEALLATHTETAEKIQSEMKKMLQLHLDGQLTAQGFGEFYKPAEKRLNQLKEELPRLQGEVDLLKVNQISEADVLAEANTLYDRWPKLPINDRRKIAETICEKITIGSGKIRITFTHIPSSGELCKNLTRC